MTMTNASAVLEAGPAQAVSLRGRFFANQTFHFEALRNAGYTLPCAFPSTDRTGQSTSLLGSRSPYCWGNDSHPPPSALYKAIRFVVTAVWLCAKRSSLS